MRGSRRLLGFLIRASVLLVVEAGVLLVLSAILPGVEQLSFDAALLVAVVMAIINAVLWPVVIRLALTLTLITFGLLAHLLAWRNLCRPARGVHAGRRPPAGSGQVGPGPPLAPG